MRRYLIPLACLLLTLSQAAAAAPANPYTVGGIAVQASAPSSVEAQTAAINSGKQRAWTELYHRLTRQEDWSRQPVLDDTALTRLIARYMPSNERRSTTRYSATMTYVFNPGAVRHLLHSQDIGYADQEAKPVMVIPLAPHYQPHSAWAVAWANPKYAHGAVPIVLPPAGAAASMGGVDFAAPDEKAIEDVAGQIKASDSFLALAIPADGHMTVRIKRVGLGQSAPIPDIDIPLPAHAPAAAIYGTVADATAQAIVNAWKAHAEVDYNRHTRLTADIRFDSLSQWGAMQEKLANVPNVADLDLTAIDMGEARVAITYVGNIEQLHDNMSKAGFDLVQSGGTWTITALDAASADASPQ